MEPLLVGVETEYGLLIEGRGADDQIEDSMALVRSSPDQGLVAWDYRHESPRADLRGFQLERLAVDPVDAQFDAGKQLPRDQDLRSDRILPNGARFYNDHGHPEYSTPECRSLRALAEHDFAGAFLVKAAADAYAQREGLDVRIYKNNTDFHGASYGTHESYLVPRALGFERLYRAVAPMLVARTILCGAGKAGAESGAPVAFQMSQRADFFMEGANAETLFRRPVFNTRDEAHADPADWIRLHVIAGDANMMPACTARKVGLVRLALRLEIEEVAPDFALPHPVQAFQAVSRDLSGNAKIELAKGSWTTAPAILESLFAAAESRLLLDEEERSLIAECRALLQLLAAGAAGWDEFRRHVDWAAKKWLLGQVAESEGIAESDPRLASYDLAYSLVDPDEGLFFALVEMGETPAIPTPGVVAERLARQHENTRAKARGYAVRHLRAHLRTGCWRSLTFELDGKPDELELPPHLRYPDSLESLSDPRDFLAAVRALRPDPS